MIEEILKNLCISDSDWSVYYFNSMDTNQSGLIGEVPVRIPNNLKPYITQVASGKRLILKKCVLMHGIDRKKSK